MLHSLHTIVPKMSPNFPCSVSIFCSLGREHVLQVPELLSADRKLVGINIVILVRKVHVCVAWTCESIFLLFCL